MSAVCNRLQDQVEQPAATCREVPIAVEANGTCQPIELALLAISGRDRDALRANARAFARHLRERADLDLLDICHTAALRRTHLPMRCAVSGDREQLAVALESLAADRELSHGHVDRIRLVIADGTAHAHKGPNTLAAALRTTAAAAGIDAEPSFQAWYADLQLRPLARFAAALSACEAWRDWGVEPDELVACEPGFRAAMVAYQLLSATEAITELSESPCTPPPVAPPKWSMLDAAAAQAAIREGDVAGYFSIRIDHPSAVHAAASLAHQLARCYEAGVALRWDAILRAGKHVDLPVYAFQRRSFPLGRVTIAARAGREQPEAAAESASESPERAAVLEVLGLATDELVDMTPLSDYGLDSLLALELRDRLRRRGIHLALEVLTSDPSLQDLIAAASQHERSRNDQLPACPEDTPFPLTDIQRAYWVGRMGFVPLGRVSCHFYTEVEVEDLDVERLQAAIDRLIARHDALRIVIDSEGRQRVLAHVEPYKIEILKVYPDDFEEVLLRERERVSHEVRPADQWPLFSWRLLDRGGHTGILQVSYDLLIADAASLMILTDEAARLYSDPAAELDPIGVTFHQCVLAESDREDLARASDYWSARLPGFPGGPELPLARSAEQLERHRFARLRGVLDTANWSLLEQAGRAHRLTPSAVLCAAYAATLSRWSETERFALNVTVFRRPAIHPDVHRVVGDFTSFIPLVVELDSATTFAELAARVKQTLWNDLAHIDGAGARLLRQLSERRGEPFLAPVVFTSLLGFNTGSPLMSLDSLGSRVYTSTQTPQVWLDHQALSVPSGVELTWDFVEGLFDQQDVQHAFDSHLQLLGALSQPDAWAKPLTELCSANKSRSRPRRSLTGAERGTGELNGAELPLDDVPDELIAELGNLVAETLGLEDLSADSDLLACGATSLELIQLATTLERRYGARPSVRELYRVRTVRKLAAYYHVLRQPAEQRPTTVLADADDRARFKKTSSRRLDGALELVQMSAPKSLVLPAENRRSIRTFNLETVTQESLADLFSALSPSAAGRRYPSAGATYPVRIYLHVPDARVQGLAAGVYAYEPERHSLGRIAADPVLDRLVHWPANREIFDQAAFGCFLVANLDLVEPLYGEFAREFCLIEAGAVAQLLMESAPTVGLGLCPIGGLDVAPVRELCELDDQDAMLLCLLGGRPGTPRDDSADTVPIADTDALLGLVPTLKRKPPTDARAADQGSDVLLTGSTGFLGAYLVRSLLDAGRRVLCLARGDSADTATARIRENMQDHQLWCSGDERSIVPLPADLAGSEPLTADTIRELGGDVSQIFHCASHVNWLAPFETLFAPNVLGTQRVLELAIEVGAELHHISSTAVFPFGAEKSYSEEESLNHGGLLIGAYPQTKWIAERLVRDAHELGVQVTIYRPGLIAGSSTTGSSNPSGFFESMIRGCIELGLAPRLQTNIDVVPVDFVARAIVALSDGPPGETYHLVNPSPIPYMQLIAWMRERGYQVQERDFDSWLEGVLSSQRLADSALGPFADYLRDADSEQFGLPTIGCERATAALAKSDIACPQIDSTLLETYISHLVSRGLPAGSASTSRSHR